MLYAAAVCTLATWFVAGWYWLIRKRLGYWYPVLRLQRAVCWLSGASVLFLLAEVLVRWR